MGRFLIVISAAVIFLLFFIDSECEGQTTWRTVSLPPLKVSSTKRPVYKCACESEEQTETICASNGIKYKSDCAFNCAKRRVPRLRKVKPESCSLKSRESYWAKAGR